MIFRSRVLLALLAGGAVATGTAGAAGEPLADLGRIRALPAGEVANRPAARVRGVVTFHEAEAGITYLQEGGAGVALAAGIPSRLPAGLRAGMTIEVAGRVAPGNYAPVITGGEDGVPEVRILGEGAMPVPLRAGIEELQGGANDGRWVELRGIVRSQAVKRFAPGWDGAGAETSEAAVEGSHSLRLSLELGTTAGRFTVIVPWSPGLKAPEDLLDARVRVRGVLGSIVNRWRQWVGLLIFVPALTEIEVERPPSADPFALPLRRVDEVMQFSALPSGEARVRVRGVVTMVQPGYRLFLRGDGGPLEVQTRRPLAGIEPGVEVDVVGYPTLGVARVLLQDGKLREIGRQAVPRPAVMGWSELMARYADGELVRIDGRLFQNALRGTSRVLVVESEGRLLEAKFANTLSAREDARVGEIQTGAEVALTGIAQVSGAADWGGGVRPYAVNLLMRRPADLVVLQEPPWWTPTRLLAAVGALIFLVAVSFSWVVLLRRRVAAQTRVIHEQALREVHERERRRIAQDIHDDLGSRLTQLALLGARVRTAAMADAPTRALGERIAETARTTVQTMDEIVWAVNPGNDTLQSLGDYLCKVATSLLGGAEIACQLEVPAVLPERRLNADQRHNLVLAVREALHNVVKHSKASAGTLCLRNEGGELILEVCDNGSGIPATGAGRGNGLGNLRRRLTEVGGKCEIGPGPAGGTCVRLASPLTPS